MTKIIKAGRPKAIEDKKLNARNLEIYSLRHCEKWNLQDLMLKFNLGRAQVFQVLKDVGEQIGQEIPEKLKLQGHIFGIEEKMKSLNKILKEELSRGKLKSARNIKDISSELRAENLVLLNLENLLKSVIKIERDDTEPTTPEIVKAILEAQESKLVPEDKVPEVAIELLKQKKKD